MKYLVNVPPTMEQGGYSTIARDDYQTKSADALQDYNSARDHDGLPPIKRMPKGTTYTPLYIWVVQQFTGRQYGWEDVYTGEGVNREARADALARIKEYRENRPEYAHRLKRKPSE